MPDALPRSIRRLALNPKMPSSTPPGGAVAPWSSGLEKLKEGRGALEHKTRVWTVAGLVKNTSIKFECLN